MSEEESEEESEATSSQESTMCALDLEETLDDGVFEDDLMESLVMDGSMLSLLLMCQYFCRLRRRKQFWFSGRTFP